MPDSIIPIKVSRRRAVYDVTIASVGLLEAGEWATASLERKADRILVISNRRVHGLYGADVERSLRSAGFEADRHLIGDGERFKNFHTLETVLDALSRLKFTRTDAVLALGGGVVGDLAGFASSIYRRGIPFLQLPTTLLSMIDSSVGGKTGVNSSYGKNLIGTFYQPAGVLIDPSVLRTLPRRELTAGLCEAIKQAAIAGRGLFETTTEFLKRFSPGPFKPENYNAELTDLLAEQIRFKAKIVQNDEEERVNDLSSRSRKILNFGHTFAHALEKVTEYKYLKHGEAVGHGILFAAELSKRLELLGQDEVDFLNDVVHRAGRLPAIRHIDPAEILEAFKHDKKQIGTSLHWILLRSIGRPIIVPDREVPRRVLTSTLKSFIRK